jgi:L-alanine-DL-glutamate epimerase-like enolase superfamily enzyme
MNMESQYYFDIHAIEYPFAGEGFKISREIKSMAETVTLRVAANGYEGVGECIPLKRYGYTPQSIAEQLESFCMAHINLSDLEQCPAGPARFALDTALTSLAAQQQGQSVAQWMGIEAQALKPIPTAFTLSLDTPEKMAAMAQERLEFQTLKLKLGQDDLNIARLKAIAAVAPQAQFILDANEALTPASLEKLLHDLHDFPVILIEQPLPAGDDEALRAIVSSIPFAADESCHTIHDLENLKGKYQVVNLKLDKTGGLHHALQMAQCARDMGFEVMIGCMGSTSLSIYPAYLLAVASHARYVDLDGALLLQQDPYGLVHYADGCVSLAATTP